MISTAVAASESGTPIVVNYKLAPPKKVPGGSPAIAEVGVDEVYLAGRSENLSRTSWQSSDWQRRSTSEEHAAIAGTSTGK